MIDSPELVLGAAARLERSREVGHQIKAHRGGPHVRRARPNRAVLGRRSACLAGRAGGHAERENKQKDQAKKETAKVAQGRPSVILCFDAPA